MKMNAQHIEVRSKSNLQVPDKMRRRTRLILILIGIWVRLTGECGLRKRSIRSPYRKDGCRSENGNLRLDIP